MKWLSYIFAAYVLMLSFAPCGDKSDCHDEETREVISQGHHDHEHETESCSPFCICACCSVQVTPAKPNVFALIMPCQFRPASPFILCGVPEISLSIWQPPQLG